MYESRQKTTKKSFLILILLYKLQNKLETPRNSSNKKNVFSQIKET